MNVLEIELGGVFLGRVSCHDVHLVAVRLGGTRVDEEFATLDVHTSKFLSPDEHTFLIQVDSLPVAPGQDMTIRFVESELSCLEGRTISEQYPDEEAENVPFDLREEALLALREARNNASRRPGYRFLLEVADHAPIFGASSFEDHGFSFSANWDWLHPERVRIDLWTWSLDDMEHERAGRTLAKAYLALGGSARVRVNAQGEASA